MRTRQAEHAKPSSRARRTEKKRGPAGAVPTGTDDIVVHTDPAGAANLMREVVALRCFDVVLEEHDGHWQVVVRGGPHPEGALAQIVDLTASCVEDGLMRHATLSIGSRSYPIQAGSEVEIPACAA